MMRLIVITEPGFPPSEAEAIRMPLDEGIDRVHLRKPGAEEAGLRRLIEALPPACYPKLSLHDRLPLACDYGLGGVHLSGRNPAAPAGFRGSVSRSCHSLAELAAAGGEDYLFLSPVFDSLSKAGYRAGFADGQLREAAAAGTIGPRTVALGGIVPERLPLVREWGFGGAAVLGYIWKNGSVREMMRCVRRLKRFV